MMSRGFKPVGWVAGVAAAALGCYMLSLNVAAERAELSKLERSIIMTKQEIRSLQTELGTRGRLQQLENWNANVLALSAPTSAQFLDNPLTLARFDRSEPTIEDHATVQMASADAAQPRFQQPVQPRQEPSKVTAPVQYAAAPAPLAARPLVHRASLIVAEAEPAPEPKKAAQPAKKASVEAKPAAQPKKATALIDDDLAKAIGEAAKAERIGGTVGQ